MQNHAVLVLRVSFLLLFTCAGCKTLIGIEDTTVEADSRTDASEANAFSFLGFAEWSQDVVVQSDFEQDAMMDNACETAFGGNASRAATVAEITFGQITDLPVTNASSFFLLGKCPDCEGASNLEAIDGHSRVCIPPGEAMPGEIPWTVFDDCTTLTRTAVCIGEQE